MVQFLTNIRIEKFNEVITSQSKNQAIDKATKHTQFNYKQANAHMITVFLRVATTVRSTDFDELNVVLIAQN